MSPESDAVKTADGELVAVDGARLVRDRRFLACTSPLRAFVCFIELPAIRARLIKGADLGCGIGSLSLLLLERHRQLRMTGVDLFPELIDAARRSADASGMRDRFRADLRDVREIPGFVPASVFHLVVSNPPYYRLGEARLSRDPIQAAARHECNGTLDDFLRAAAHLVRPAGRVAVMQRAARCGELLQKASEQGLLVSRLQFIYTGEGRVAEEVLAEFRPRPPRNVEVLPPVRLEGGQIV